MFAATFLSYQGRFNSFSDYYLWEGLVALKRTRMLCRARNRLGALSPNTSGQLDILWHDRDTFGVNGAQVSVFKKTEEICLCRLLQCQDCPTGKVEPAFKVLGNLPYQSLKGKPPYQKFSRLLKPDESHEGPQYQAYTCVAFWVPLAALRPSSMVA